MQPFLSGETTMVYLLTVLTFLFFVAAGTDHPVDQIHIQEPVHVARPVPCKSAPAQLSFSHAEPVIAYIITHNSSRAFTFNGINVCGTHEG